LEVHQSRRSFFGNALAAAATAALIQAQPLLKGRGWLAAVIPGFSAQVAAVLNSLATIVNPSPAVTFVSPFANLSFAEKAGVFQIMDATAGLQQLGGILPPFAAFFTYSDAGTFDPTTRSLTGEPLGWTLSHYQGVADGRDELLGYFPGPRNPR
jgi:hypothetical protein